ncbi:MAG: patatin-like phospholipase family protein [Phycisphaerae bacterium]|nr:patatin-like phospholipase family protein [Phycisphaerae bacterium]
MPETNAQFFRILSFDGGGIRGIISAVWLDALEYELGGPIREHCDLIAGTSTGSILACAAALGIPAAQIRDLYRRRGRDVFTPLAPRLWNRLLRTLTQGLSAPKYDDRGLREVLESTFGSRRLADLPPTPRLLIPAYNTLARQAVVIKSNSAAFASLPLWEAAKASSSAPTYFPAHVARLGGAEVPLIDGGVVANNPVVCAIAEGLHVCSDRDGGIGLEQFVVGSFGTGQATRPIPAKQAREWGPLEWAVPVLDVLMDGAADAMDYIARQLLREGRYVRLQTELNHACDRMDDVEKGNIVALLRLAERYLDNQGGTDRIMKLAELLRGGAR